MKSSKTTTGNGLNENSAGAIIVQNDPSQREHMIAISAYFRAQNRGFSPNEEEADWLASEQEVDSHLNSFIS